MPGLPAGANRLEPPLWRLVWHQLRLWILFGDSTADILASVSLMDGSNGAGAEATTTSPGGTVASPKWSYVVKQGRGRRTEIQSTLVKGQSALAKCRTDKPAHRRPKPIIGTGAQGNVKVVQTKLVRVFATKFLPDLDAVTAKLS